ncbi:SDR family oxidoreductase, partial [Candidatus Omnitrophota bacterium]
LLVSYLDKLFSLNGKRVIVTGVCGQLGLAILSSLKKVGAYVVGIDVMEESPKDLDEYYKVDISSKEEVVQLFRQVKMCNVLINNAGVSVFEPFSERTEKSFDYVMNVNLKGTFWCIQQYVETFERDELSCGSIVNIGSVFGCVSPDFRNYTDCNRRNSEIYGATKAGVVQMTKYFAVHLADKGIRVNAVSPGGIYNEKNPQGEDFIKNYSYRCPMKRMAKVDEITGTVLFLAGNASCYINGQNIIVDGGMTSW